MTTELCKINGDAWHTIWQFLEYISEKEVWLAKYYEATYSTDMHPISSQDKERLVYGFFDTTPKKCEKERKQILENIRRERRESNR